ncbi:hypothetical protein GCM10028791_33160 [Echinicola sediminis]
MIIQNRISWTVLIFTLLFGSGYARSPEQTGDSVVYVWDFAVSHPEVKTIGQMLTDDFETELIGAGLYTVLERRNYNRVIAHRDLEKRISEVNNISAASLDSLKAVKADVVIFGQVIDDVQSGEYEVEVTFQGLNGVILRKASKLIKRGIINDNSSRKSAMRDLVELLHLKEREEKKRVQYEFISSWLNRYMVRLKDVNNYFKQVSEYAFSNNSYITEINKIVNDYNTVFSELNENSSNYISNFRRAWGGQSGDDLQEIYDMIMDDIHKPDILGLNDLLKEIIDYSGLSKRQQREKKREILNDAQKITNDLDRQINILEAKVILFQTKLREEM